jgi:hypothetical protein
MKIILKYELIRMYLTTLISKNLNFMHLNIKLIKFITKQIGYVPIIMKKSIYNILI